MSKVATFPENLLAGELARLAGVSTDTLRHYERKGVLPKPLRLPNGYRKYPASSLERVRLIRRAIALGFTLDELARFLKAREEGRPPCREVRALAAEKLRELEKRLEEMLALRDELRETLTDWETRLARSNDKERAGLLDALAGREARASNTDASARTRILRRKRQMR